MESSGPTPHGAVAAPDLAEVAQEPGPFTTVYLTTEADIENAGQLSEQRWKTLRGELAEAGTSERVLASIDDVVPDAHLHGPGLAVVSGESGVLLVEHGPRPPRRDEWRRAPLPALVPVIQWRQLFPPYVAVVTDRLGADIFGVRYGAPELHQEVDSESYPIRKVGPGGWSQRRYQERAENQWDDNAENVADALVRLASRVQPRLVVAGGDVRALQLLRDALPQEWTQILEVAEGVPPFDRASLDVLADDIDRFLSEAVARDTASLLEKFREEAGQQDRAAEGVPGTLTALSAAQVEVLLVHDDPQDERLVWFGPEPSHLSERPDELLPLGINQPRQGRLVDATVRSALATGASVRVVPSEMAPRDGVGAILRWSS